MKRPHFALPEIYDDSLSYYDVLRKLIKSMHAIVDNLNKIPEQIANEAKAREQADGTLQTNIDNEEMARQEADNELRELISMSGGGVTEAQLNEEVKARQQADTALQNAINAEKSAREQADGTLQTNIDNEEMARQEADNELRELISMSGGGVTEAQLNEEVKARQQGDNALQEKINTNKNDISELKSDLVAFDDSLRGNTSNYYLGGKIERGGISSGNNYDGGTEYKKNHWRSKEFILDGYKDITIQSNDDNFTFKVWILSSMTGKYNDSGWVTQFEIDGNDKYRIAFARFDDAEFSEQDILSHISIVGTKSYTDKTLSIENVSADAKKTGTEINSIKDFISYKKDISDKVTIHYGKNVYFSSGILVFEDSNQYRSRTDLFNTSNIDILVNLKDGIKAIYYVKEDGVWTNPVIWMTGAFYLPKNVEVYLAFGKTDGSTFIGDEPLADFTEIHSNNTNLVPKFRLIHSISQELVISDNNNESGAMQGMCFDGENIWYYLSSINSLRKYNINTKETTQYADLGLGHGNDITYNPNTRKLYVAFAEGTRPIVKTIDIDTMTVGEFELNEIDGPIASIAYSKDTDEYVVIGGQAYDRDGNTDGWTRKQMIIYDKNFDHLKSIILKNDYSATQGVEFDGRYIYFCKSFYNGSHNDKVYVYDINGNIVNSFSSGTGEVEAISKIDDYNFYIARNENSYKGGYVYKATVTSESYVNIVDVLYEKYIN